MKTVKGNAGLLFNGIPYNRFGEGNRILIIFQGLFLFDNKPLQGKYNWIFERYYQYLERDYTIFLVLPKHNLPKGYTLKDIANDFAVMIEHEFTEPVDIMGESTGGSIAQYFAADHPNLVRKLIIHSSAHTLSDFTKRIQLAARDQAMQHKWRAAYAEMFDPVFRRSGNNNKLNNIIVYKMSFIIGKTMALLYGAPKEPNDFIITVEAEDQLDFKNRLAEISIPTLVVAGEDDPYYSVELFRETAEGIPNSKLILYKGMGHPAGGPQFRSDVLSFLRETL